MRGEGSFSILEGLIYRWQGTTSSTGRVTDSGPEPAMYALRYSDGGRRGEQLRMTFDGGSVQKVTIYPSRRQNPRTIPVTKEQLEGVLDPMSGAFLTASSQNPNGDLAVCNQILPVFDGLQRFDLVLSPKRHREEDDEGRLWRPCRDLPREVHPDCRLPARQSRHQDDVPVGRDRGLAHPCARHIHVRAIPDCLADAGGLWVRGGVLDPRGRRKARKSRSLAGDVRARSASVNARPPNPNIL